MKNVSSNLLCSTYLIVGALSNEQAEKVLITKIRQCVFQVYNNLSVYLSPVVFEVLMQDDLLLEQRRFRKILQGLWNRLLVFAISKAQTLSYFELMKHHVFVIIVLITLPPNISKDVLYQALQYEDVHHHTDTIQNFF